MSKSAYIKIKIKKNREKIKSLLEGSEGTNDEARGDDRETVLIAGLPRAA